MDVAAQERKAWLDEKGDFWSASAVFYSCDEHAEALTHDDPDDAIDAYLDEELSPEDDDPLAVVKAKFGETLEVYAFKRRVMDHTDPDPERVLEDVLERLDEEYGGEDATEPTEPMKAIAEAFCATIRAEYGVWQCDGCGSAKVNIETWVRENHPEWQRPS
jgi:hypothetical protein